ncbi:uncharacterized protein L201_003244 [Kwoniella dendrophila CBS 6074]|uniref:WSC domain-containing protein n=1 Tax=Kwoniella dendrophila CBS 6074 TaxID=1295534 RepID=A0AAX4JSQ7_9TREE
MYYTLSVVSLSFFLAIYLIGSALAQDHFAGCYQQGPDSGEDDTYFYFDDNISDPDVCATMCSDWNYAWVGYGYLCYCSSGFVSPNRMINGQEDTCASSGSTEARVVSTTFTFLDCGSGRTTASKFDIDGPKNCFESCKNSLYAGFNYDENSSTGYSCTCLDSLNGESHNDCGPAATFYYSHLPAAAASGLSRRNARLADLQYNKKLSERTCPWGLTACLIPGLENSDALGELESCGGCIHGAYGNETASIGDSCLKDGVKLGAATCVEGRCIAYGCEAGFTLIDGECVAGSWS